MSTISKEWLQQKIADMEEHRDLFPGDLDDDHANVLASLRITLASLEAEAVAFVMADDLKDSSIISTPAYRDLGEAMERTVGDVVALYAAPPAPVSVPDALEDDIHSDDHPLLWSYNNGWNACRAAMLQGADRKPELTVWYGSMPESNGKANWTAILHRKGEGRCMDGFTIDRSEYPDRVRYSADRVRYLIGEKSERPSILDYDADAHSGYVKPGNSPAIPDGYALVPVEPTEHMIVEGFESEPDEFFSDEEVWEAYDAMSGCQQAAHRAKLCWAAMIAAAPKI